MANPLSTDYHDKLIEILQHSEVRLIQSPIWLGASAGPDGGSGQRPGGFIGYLPQTRVAYDTTERATLSGSASLLDNLNHIRYRIESLSGVVFSGLSFLDLIDTPDTYTTHSGQIVAVASAEDQLEFITLTASGISDFNEAVDDRVSNLLVAGSGIEITYDDPANTLTIEAIAGSGDLTYIHEQGTASSTWNVNHGLNKFPSVMVVDSAGTHVEGDITYIDQNNVTLQFSAPFSGKAYFN